MMLMADGLLIFAIVADHEEFLVADCAVGNRFAQLQHCVLGRNAEDSAVDGQLLTIVKTKRPSHDLIQTRGWTFLGIQSDALFRDVEDIIRLELAGDLRTDGHRIHDAEVMPPLALL